MNKPNNGGLLYRVTADGSGGAVTHEKRNMEFLDAVEHAKGLQSLGYEHIRLEELPATKVRSIAPKQSV